VLAGLAVGLLLALVLWVFLFGRLFILVAPPRYPTFEAAQPIAVDEGGRYRWPGTAIRVREVDPRRFDVERRWLGLRESVVRVERTQAGWDVGSPRTGPARAMQEILACVVPAVAVGWLAARGLRRRSTQPTEAGPESQHWR